jgi:hypothetical protein
LSEGAGFLFGAKFSADGALIFSCAAGRNELKVFDNSDQTNIKCVSYLVNCAAPVLSLAVANNGRSVAYGMSDGLLGNFEYENSSRKIKDGLTSLFK